MVTQCPACGSKRLARGNVAAVGWWGGRIGLYRPGGFLGLGVGGLTTDLRAAACVDCGHVQLVAASLDAVRDLYEAQRRGSLQLGDQTE